MRTDANTRTVHGIRGVRYECRDCAAATQRRYRQRILADEFAFERDRRLARHRDDMRARRAAE